MHAEKVSKNDDNRITENMQHLLRQNCWGCNIPTSWKLLCIKPIFKSFI